MLAVMKGHVPALQENPGLAVWRTGDGNKDVRAVFTWPEAEVASGDGHLRLWDAAAGTVKSWDFGSGNSTAVLLGLNNDEPRVAAGSVRKSDTGLTYRPSVLQFSPDRDPQVQNMPARLSFSFDRISDRPRAGGGVRKSEWPVRSRCRSAATGGSQTRLCPGSDRRDADPAASTVRFTLENSDLNSAPVVAAAPRGKWLAVAGFKNRAIEIYSIEDLLAQRTAPAARLRSQGVLYSKAMFVRRDKEVGLWLSEDPKAAPLQDGADFNFDKRSLTDDAKGWKNDTPSRAGWDVDFKDGQAIVSHEKDGIQDETGTPVPSQPGTRQGPRRPSVNRHCSRWRIPTGPVPRRISRFMIWHPAGRCVVSPDICKMCAGLPFPTRNRCWCRWPKIRPCGSGVLPI